MDGSGPERYQIINRHGSGWTGVHYLAVDRESGRQVVLKPLPGPCGVAGGPDTPPAGFLGFEHPKIVSIYDVLEDSGVRYAVMEHVSGKTLAEVADGRGLDVSLVRTIAADCLEALTAGAERGLLHGDIKADNILILQQPDGRVQAKLQDFGLAGMEDEQAMKIIIGDVHCLAPERLAGQETDQRTDLYSLGACLYFALTGRAAFPEDDLGKVEAAHRRPPAQPLALLRPDAPAAFCKWVESLMAPDRDKRPANARVALAMLPVPTPVLLGYDGARMPAKRSTAKKYFPAKEKQRGGPWLWAGGITACCLALGYGGMLLWKKYQAERTSVMAGHHLQEVKEAPPGQPQTAQHGSGTPLRDVAIPPPAAPPPVQPVIVLRGTGAIIHGNAGTKSLRASRGGDQGLGYWLNPNEYPEWPVSVVHPGIFHITLTYALGTRTSVTGSTIDILMGGRKLSVPLKGTGNWRTYATAQLGDIEIGQAGTMTLAIKPVTKKAKAVMNLRSLTLTWRERG